MSTGEILSTYIDSCKKVADINTEMQLSDEIDTVIWMPTFYQLPIHICIRILKYCGKKLTEIQSRQVLDGFMRTCGIEALKLFPYLNCGTFEQLIGPGPLQKNQTQENFIHEPLIPHVAELHSPKPKPRVVKKATVSKSVPHYMISPNNHSKSISFFKLDVPQLAVPQKVGNRSGPHTPISPRKKVNTKEEEDEAERKERYDLITIFSAAEASELKTVEKIIHEKPEIINAKLNNETLLHVAMRKRDMKLAGILIRCGCDINALNEFGSTPLYTAIYNDYIPGIDFLLSQGAKVDIKNNKGNTPLHWAAECRKIHATKILLSYGADINARNDKKETPLIIAAERGPLQLVREFLLAGADASIENMYGEKPADVAQHPDIQAEIANKEAEKK